MLHDIIKGLELFGRCGIEPFYGEHNPLYVGPLPCKEALTKEDRSFLEALGWQWDEESQGWEYFT